jgi:hypothetical protein
VTTKEPEPVGIGYHVATDGTLLFRIVDEGRVVIIHIPPSLLPELKTLVDRAMANAAAEESAMCPMCKQPTVRKFENGAVFCWRCSWSPA